MSAADRRRRRLPQRRQEHPGQPPGRGSEAVTHAEPGVTRDRKRVACEWNGVALRAARHRRHRPRGRGELAARHPAPGAGLAMAEADVGPAGRRRARRACAPETPSWRRRCAAATSRCSSSPTRSTAPSDEHLAAEFNRLGLGEPLAVSATHGLGSGDLLDRVVELLGDAPRPPSAEEAVRVAVIGRPNVGKSSLVNAFLGSERVIVSERPGRPATRSTPSSRSTAGA